MSKQTETGIAAAVVDADAVDYAAATIAAGRVTSAAVGSRAAGRRGRVARGMPMLAAVDAFAVESAAVGSAASRICDAVAVKFHIDGGDLLAVVTDSLAGWLGADDPIDRADRLHSLTAAAVECDHSEYAAGAAGRRFQCIDQCATRRADAASKRGRALIRKIARNAAPRLSTGRGTRPRLVDPTDWDDLSTHPLVTRWDGDGDGRVTTPMTDAESDQWVHTSGYERAESDLYSPMVTAYGDLSPIIGSDSTHAYGGPPLGVPERDTAGLSTASLVERIDAVDAPTIDKRAAVDALAAVKLSARGAYSVEWSRVVDSAAARGDTRHRVTLSRAVERVLTAAAVVVVDTDRATDDRAEWTAPARHSCTTTCTHAGPVRWGSDSRTAAEMQLPAPMVTGSRFKCEHAVDSCPRDCAARVHRAEWIDAVERCTTRAEYARLVIHRERA